MTEAASKSRPFFLAIVGGSGSGKSWLAEGLEKKLRRKALRISLDDFYLDRSDLTPEERARLNFDHPSAIDWRLFRDVIEELREGRSTRLPVYDFATHCRRSKHHPIKAREVVLVEGLWLLHSRGLRRFFNLTVFLQCCRKTRLARRCARDLKTRGRTPQSVLEQFRTTVQPMHKRFVEPQKRWARIVWKEGFSAKDIEKMADLIRTRWAEFSSARALKRGNTR